MVVALVVEIERCYLWAITIQPEQHVRFLCSSDAVDVKKAGYNLRSGLGLPGPEESPEGCSIEGVSLRLSGSEGSPEDGSPEVELVEPPPEAEAELGTGAGGDTFCWFWNTRIASKTAMAASNSISKKDARRVSQPARSLRPGQGSGHIRQVPGRMFCHQCIWKSGPAGEPSWGVCTRSTAASTRCASATAAGEPEKARATHGARGR